MNSACFDEHYLCAMHKRSTYFEAPAAGRHPRRAAPALLRSVPEVRVVYLDRQGYHDVRFIGTVSTGRSPWD
ncbi:hypothetical protein AB0I68_35880 [Streptomyces sp. NPDC050448]|uniref:hypothetical protein n=1 Tax=Streptomyces sp. NPDC050448 TaxID=3155404 RepID=UPI00342E6F80